MFTANFLLDAEEVLARLDAFGVEIGDRQVFNTFLYLFADGSIIEQDFQAITPDITEYPETRYISPDRVTFLTLEPYRVDFTEPDLAPAFLNEFDINFEGGRDRFDLLDWLGIEPGEPAPPGRFVYDFGGGTDTVEFDVPFQAGTVRLEPAGDDAVQLVYGGRETVLIDLERIEFADATVTVRDGVPTGGGLGLGLPDDDARTVAYLYEAGLDRNGEIDPPGLNFWIDQREAGLSERGLSQAFLDSAEFAAAFGAPETLTDRALVEQLYRNVLEREGEEGGIAFWEAQLARPAVSRADMLLAFAGSPENVAGSPDVLGLTEVAPGAWDFLS